MTQQPVRKVLYIHIKNVKTEAQRSQFTSSRTHTVWKIDLNPVPNHNLGPGESKCGPDTSRTDTPMELAKKQASGPILDLLN